MDKELLGLRLILGGFISLLGSYMIMEVTSYWVQFLIPLHLLPIGFYLVIHYNSNKQQNYTGVKQ